MVCSSFAHAVAERVIEMHRWHGIFFFFKWCNALEASTKQKCDNCAKYQAANDYAILSKFSSFHVCKDSTKKPKCKISAFFLLLIITFLQFASFMIKHCPF